MHSPAVSYATMLYNVIPKDSIHLWYAALGLCIPSFGFEISLSLKIGPLLKNLNVYSFVGLISAIERLTSVRLSVGINRTVRQSNLFSYCA